MQLILPASDRLIILRKHMQVVANFGALMFVFYDFNFYILIAITIFGKLRGTLVNNPRKINQRSVKINK